MKTANIVWIFRFSSKKDRCYELYIIRILSISGSNGIFVPVSSGEVSYRLPAADILVDLFYVWLAAFFDPCNDNGIHLSDRLGDRENRKTGQKKMTDGSGGFWYGRIAVLCKT